jgi:hypothetical protein
MGERDLLIEIGCALFRIKDHCYVQVSRIVPGLRSRDSGNRDRKPNCRVPRIRGSDLATRTRASFTSGSGPYAGKPRAHLQSESYEVFARCASFRNPFRPRFTETRPSDGVSRAAPHRRTAGRPIPAGRSTPERPAVSTIRVARPAPLTVGPPAVARGPSIALRTSRRLLEGCLGAPNHTYRPVRRYRRPDEAPNENSPTVLSLRFAVDRKNPPGNAPMNLPFGS